MVGSAVLNPYSFGLVGKLLLIRSIGSLVVSGTRFYAILILPQ